MTQPDTQPPVPRSTVIKGIEWLSERLPYPDMAVTGDSYPLTWADDDALYTSSGDPMWHGCMKDEGLDLEKIEGCPPHHRISRVNDMYGYRGFGGSGPKPSGMICVGGVLYFAVQNLLGMKPPAHGEKCQHGSDAHIIVSRDHGKTWTPNLRDIKTPMFPGHLFGGPTFINYGKDNEGARDAYVYAVSGDQWDNGSELRLGRVPADRITEKEAWEWVGSLTGAGAPRWTNDLTQSIPILRWDRHIGIPDMMYLGGIKRYLLLTWRLHEDFAPQGSDLILLESPEPWGPFSLVHCENWEDAIRTPYCPKLPLKWMEPDGLSGWLLHSGNWMSPEDQGLAWRPYYRVNLRKFRIKLT
jgi:hypothetical protein